MPRKCALVLMLCSAIASVASTSSSILRLPIGGSQHEADSSTTSMLGLSMRYPHSLIQLYESLGFGRCAHAHQELERSRAWLYVQRTVDCAAVARAIMDKNSKAPPYPPPQWTDLTAKQQELFTLGGIVHVYPWYLIDFKQDAEQRPPKFFDETLNGSIAWHKERKDGAYGPETINLYNAFDEFSVKGKRVAVYGTQVPWVEGMLFAAEAAHVTTVEYQATTTAAPHHDIITPLQMAERIASKQGVEEVDMGISYSSYEHDGLARYGDPLDPWGDITTMQLTSCHIKPGGLLMLAVPCGVQDQVNWNAHRVYSLARLPLLTANWELLAVFWDGRHFSHERGQGSTNFTQGFTAWWASLHSVGIKDTAQPVMVLRNARTSPCHANH